MEQRQFVIYCTATG